MVLILPRFVDLQHLGCHAMWTKFVWKCPKYHISNLAHEGFGGNSKGFERVGHAPTFVATTKWQWVH